MVFYRWCMWLDSETRFAQKITRLMWNQLRRKSLFSFSDTTETMSTWRMSCKSRNFSTAPCVSLRNGKKLPHQGCRARVTRSSACLFVCKTRVVTHTQWADQSRLDIRGVTFFITAVIGVYYTSWPCILMRKPVLAVRTRTHTPGFLCADSADHPKVDFYFELGLYFIS